MNPIDSLKNKRLDSI